jgi:hypothetical protein
MHNETCNVHQHVLRDSPFLNDNNHGGGFGEDVLCPQMMRCKAKQGNTGRQHLIRQQIRRSDLPVISPCAVGDGDKVRLHTVEYENEDSAGMHA